MNHCSVKSAVFAVLILSTSGLAAESLYEVDVKIVLAEAEKEIRRQLPDHGPDEIRRLTKDTWLVLNCTAIQSCGQLGAEHGCSFHINFADMRTIRRHPERGPAGCYMNESVDSYTIHVHGHGNIHLESNHPGTSMISMEEVDYKNSSREDDA